MRIGLRRFALPPADGIPAQARNLSQAYDTTATKLLCQYTNDEPSASFVQSSQQTIDRTVLFRPRAGWLKLAFRTGTAADSLLLEDFHGAPPSLPTGR